MPAPRRVRGVYSGPLTKKIDMETGAVKIDRNLLRKIGETLVHEIVREAKIDFAKRRKSGRGKPIPDGGGIGPADAKPGVPSFFESWSYRIKGKRTVEVVCSWPWIDSLLEGRPAGPMTHLTVEGNPEMEKKVKEPRRMRPGEGFTEAKKRVRRAIPLKTKDGTVIFRTVPFKTQDAWIHPGIAKHTFMERGVKKARAKLPKIISRWLTEGRGR